MASLDHAITRLRRWRENPNSMALEEFKFKPDKWQEHALSVFPSQDKGKIRMAMKACVGPGKTAVLAIMGWNFLLCYGEKGEHPKGAAVSVTQDNLRDNLWPEMSKFQSRSDILKRTFVWTKERIFAKDHPETWFLAARSWSKRANQDEQGRTLSGLHAKYVLVIIDESGDIPVPVLKAGEQVLSNCAWGKIVQAGNPSSLEGVLYHSCVRQSHLWYVITITGDPDNPNRSPRISAEWAREQINLFGRDNPWVMSSILGEFPPSSINSLLGPEEIEAAFRLHLPPSSYDFAQKRLGVDVARFGDDRTILFPRQGLQAYLPVEMRNARGPEVAARIAVAKERWHQELAFIDDTGGFGGSVCDACVLARIDHLPINFASKAADPRYYNRRAEMHFRAAEMVKRGMSLPNKSSLIREATAATYTLKDGKLLIEPKAMIKARLGFSPDEWDAFCLTFALPDMPSENSPTAALLHNREARMSADYDPMRGEIEPA